MMLVGIEGDDPRAAARASRALAAALAADPRFGVVANGDASRFAAERDLVWRWRYLLSPTEGPDRFAVDGLRAALDESLRLFASPLGPAIRGTMAADPTGETRAILAAARRRRGPRAARGRLVRRGGQRALLVVADARAGIRPRCAAGGRARELVATRSRAIAPPGARPGDDEAGAARGRVARGWIERDAQVASTVTGVAVLGLLYLVYRSVWPVLLSALPALTGMAAGIVAVSAAFGPGPRADARLRGRADRRGGGLSDLPVREQRPRRDAGSHRRAHRPHACCSPAPPPPAARWRCCCPASRAWPSSER